MGLIINESDPYSVAVGDYYRMRRAIPARNVVRVNFAVTAELTPVRFAAIKRTIDGKLPRTVQFLALAWTEPFRVGCMSATSAFAMGFDESYCAADCKLTPYTPYYDSDSARPYDEIGIRPAMSLAASSVAGGRALIDRGVASDGSNPRGTAYFLTTSDKARSVREPSFTRALRLGGYDFDIELLRADTLRDRTDVMFYMTGLAVVPDIATNHFLPGAIADHLTSYGGVLMGSSQMSALAWIDAGATGSFGAVVEPCAFPTKFPNPAVALLRYRAGESLIEAYWKSVAMPSQGIFVGEPLATPFRR